MGGLRSYQAGKLPGSAAFSLLLSAALLGLVTILHPAQIAGPPDVLSAYPWLYLRDDRPLIDGEPVVELIAVGDVMLGRRVAGEPDPLGAAAPWLRRADLTLGNFEGTLALPGEPPPAPAYQSTLEPILLVVPHSAPRALRRAGFDMLGMANNHTLDLGPQGFARTASRLEAAGLTPLGAGPDPMQPVVRHVNGLSLAFVAFNAVPLQQKPENALSTGSWDPGLAAGAVREARGQADVVVASVHWGIEGQRHPDPAQRVMADLLLAAGADLIVGHHPHVVQGTRVVSRAEEGPAAGDRFVAFSLGNFVFDQYGPGPGQGLALRAFFDSHGLRAVQALPIWAGRRPRLMAPDESAPLLERVAPPPLNLGFSYDGSTFRLVQVSQENGAGLFRSGEIDLDANGLPERVIRAQGGVTVTEGGRQVWRSPPEWQVLDLALGDPNDDGRQELLLALEKPDENGVLRSHPFIVGHRGGRYRVLWGGSGVSQPLREVELGDLNGDGVQELVVLEAQREEGLTAVTVWRWHGWGFSLMWRGPVGRYQEVRLLPGEAGTPLVISVARRWHHP